MGKIRVFIVDDHTILREGIRSLLETHEDMEVVGEAQDGEEAVRRVRELQPDVVLMDIGMPGMNGIEATTEIKKQHPDIKVLILSMHDNEEYIYPIFEAGASGYVLKRMATTELISAIRAVCEGHTILHPAVARTVMAKRPEEVARDGRGPEKLDQEDFDGLTEREIEILEHIARGLTNREIADRLFISIKTVQAHRANIMEKLDLHDRVELTKYALRKGLISLED